MTLVFHIMLVKISGLPTQITKHRLTLAGIKFFRPGTPCVLTIDTTSNTLTSLIYFLFSNSSTGTRWARHPRGSRRCRGRATEQQQLIPVLEKVEQKVNRCTHVGVFFFLAEGTGRERTRDPGVYFRCVNPGCAMFRKVHKSCRIHGWNAEPPTSPTTSQPPILLI